MAAALSKPTPCGVPKNGSKKVLCPETGRKEKIPPPSLFRTTTVTGSPRSMASEFRSCRSARSPISRVTGRPVPRAKPAAVATVPSIPLDGAQPLPENFDLGLVDGGLRRRVARIRFVGGAPAFWDVGLRFVFAGTWDQGLAEHQVQVDGALWGPPGAVDGLVHGRKNRGGGDAEARGGKVEAPADEIAEDVGLVYRLVRASLAQLRRTVGGQQDHGHAVRGGLDYRGEAVGDGGARGRDPGRRTPRRPGVPERRERRAPLVEVDEALGLRVLSEGGYEGRGAGAGGNAEKVDAAAGELLDDQVRPEAVSARGFQGRTPRDRKSTRLNSSHTVISYAVFCLKKKK